MYKALKIELKLTNEQKIQVNKTIGFISVVIVV